MAEYLWGSAAQLRREPPDPMAIEAVRIARSALAMDGDDPEVLWRIAPVIASPGARLDEARACDGGEVARAESQLSRSVSWP